MSWWLSQRSVEHVVLERGDVANTWRTERWDSLRLLTPNWQSRLPGYQYTGEDPDGYMTMPEVTAFLGGFAETLSAPVLTNTTVTSVRRTEDGYTVATDQGDWDCATVVLATGACNVAHVPAVAAAVPDGISTLTALQYRRPDQLDDGGVLIAGASATGVQLADEIHRSGRPVTLAVGQHVRAPRLYRGMDLMWWLDRAGVLDEGYREVDDIVRARRVPSFQLTGTRERGTTDLNTLAADGVRLVGRLAGIADGSAQFSGSLRNQCALADLKLQRLLDTIDAWATANDLDDLYDPPQRFSPTVVEADPPLGLDLRSGEIRTIIWATGYRPDYSWLDVPVFDRKGWIRHDGGVVDSPGMYLLGTPFLRRRKSTLIDGAADDTRELSEHLVAHLRGRTGGEAGPTSAR